MTLVSNNNVHALYVGDVLVSVRAGSYTEGEFLSDARLKVKVVQKFASQTLTTVGKVKTHLSFYNDLV